MNWDAIGAFGEIIGAIAVVISLLYLATQIRQSNKLAIRESRKTYTDKVEALHRLAIENPSHAELRVKLTKTDSKLTPEEEQQAISFASLIAVQIANVSASYEAGYLPPEVLQKYIDNTTTALNVWPGIAKFVETYALSILSETEASNPIYSKVRKEVELIKSANET